MPARDRRHEAQAGRGPGPRPARPARPRRQGQARRPARCPAASASGWPSPGPWPTSRRSCSPTSRPAPSTARAATRCSSCSGGCTRAARPSCMVTHDQPVADAAQRIVRMTRRPGRRRRRGRDHDGGRPLGAGGSLTAATRTNDSAALPLRPASPRGVASLPDRELHGARPALVPPRRGRARWSSRWSPSSSPARRSRASTSSAPRSSRSGRPRAWPLGIRRRQDRLGPIALAGAASARSACWPPPSITEAGSGAVPSSRSTSACASCSACCRPSPSTCCWRCPTGGSARRRGATLVVAGYVVGRRPSAWPSLADRDQVRGVAARRARGCVALGVGLGMANGRYRGAGAVDRRRMQWIGWALAVGDRGHRSSWSRSRCSPTGREPVARRLRPRPGSCRSRSSPAPIARLIARVDRAAHLHRVARRAHGAGRRHLRRRGARPRPHRPSGHRTHAAAALDGRRRPRRPPLPARPVAGSPSGQPPRLRRARRPRRGAAHVRAPASPAPSRWTSCSCSWPSRCARRWRWHSAEVWTGADGRYELAAGVPHRDARRRSWSGPRSAPVVARAGVSGGTWIDIWLPGAGRPARRRRRCGSRRSPTAASCSGSSSCARPRRRRPFTEDDDRVLTELARQVGLALHNVQLDSALQASLEELQHTNIELHAVACPHRHRRRRRAPQARAKPARRRPAAPRRAGGEAPAGRGRRRGRPGRRHRDARRAARRPAGRDRRAAGPGPRHLPAAAGVGRSGRGAAAAAAARAALPTTVDMHDVEPLPTEIEAAVYFCCLEAMQNAGKHAGDGAHHRGARVGATATLRVRGGRRRRRLRRRGHARRRATASSTWPTASARSAARSTCGRRPGRGTTRRAASIPRPATCTRLERRSGSRAAHQRETQPVRQRSARSGSPPSSQRRRTVRGLEARPC